MKKSIIYLLVAVLTAFMAMPQEAMAKKINYLGHLYKGEVNKEKVPQGKGEIRIKDFVIKGIFDNCTVTNADVRLDDSVDGPHNTIFNGTIIYDESDSILLKAGGELTIRVLQGCWTSDIEQAYRTPLLKKWIFFDTIKFPQTEDKYCCSELFEQEVVLKPHDYNLLGEINGKFPSIDKDKLNPPINLKSYDIYRLKKVCYFENREARQQQNWNHSTHNEEWLLYMNQEDWRKNTTFQDVDAEGRTWTCITEYADYNKQMPLKAFEVKYPNGNSLSARHVNCTWEIHYPDSLVVKYNGSGRFDLGNGMFVLQNHNHVDANVFFDYSKKDKFYLTKDNIGGVCSPLIQPSTPSLYVEKLIKDNLAPYVDIDNLSHVSIYCGDNYTGTQYGYLSDGKVFSSNEAQQALDEQEQKQEQEAYDKLCKKYGKKYVDAYNDDKVIIGMPEGLVKSFRHRVVAESASGRTYNLINVFNEVVATVYVHNGKVARVRYYR